MSTGIDTSRIEGDYDRDGVIRLRGFFSPQLVAEARLELERYIRDVLPGLAEPFRTYEPDGISVRNMWRLELHSDHFKRLAENPDMLKLVSQLVHGEPVLHGIETFNKPARTGTAVPWHQDNAYFCQSPPDMLTVWVAIDPATIENGAIYYWPGSHRALQPHSPSGVLGNSFGVTDPPNLELTDQFCGTLQAGDALIHHSQTMHRSDPNLTAQPRCGLLFVYRGAHAVEVPAMKRAYQGALDSLGTVAASA